MTWDSVPWFVGGGATHSPEVARLLAYAATSGAEGIITPGDLKVVPLATPGASVRVLAGAALILNRAAGGASQTYVARNPSEDVKGIASTGSSGGRTDLVVAQIKDPFLAGEPWANPADPTVGPYIFSEVLPNVPASAVVDNASATAYIASQGLSAIPLAAVIMPVSTATVTANEIKDLRGLALPRTFQLNAGGSPTAQNHLAGYKETGDPFNMARLSSVHPTIKVPKWATHVDIIAQAFGLYVRAPQTFGAALVRLGPEGQPSQGAYGPHTNFDFTDAALETQPRQIILSSALNLPLGSMAGTEQELTLRIRLDGGEIRNEPWSYLLFQVHFHERAV